MIKHITRIPYWYLLILPWFLNYLGSAMNVIVEGLNHAQMPVLPPGGQCTPEIVLWMTKGGRDVSHVCMSAASHLKFFFCRLGQSIE